MRPAHRRDGARLLVLDRGGDVVGHTTFRELSRLLRPRSLLVLNDTRVFPARLHGRKASGGQVEVLLLERFSASDSGEGRAWQEDWKVLGRGLSGTKTGAPLTFGPSLRAQVLDVLGGGELTLRFSGQGADLLTLAEQIGAVPLPPYIEAARRRDPTWAQADLEDDKERYQTVYARVPGAVAAPTAGLHFTTGLLEEIAAAGHELARLTLHVGPGTFRPVETADPAEHRMDPERYHVPVETAKAVDRARAEGRPVVAVGTTVVRALEAAGRQGPIVAGAGATDLFLRPGSSFRVVTDLVTNFHLPRSTLLMLVAAFAGRERVLAAYDNAVQNGYRFYSYGDAMFIRGAERAR